MKTRIETIIASVVIYGLLFLVLTGLTFGSELVTGGVENVDSAQVNIEYTFEEEAYIDDIPFDTELVAETYVYQESLKVEYQFAEEAYIDDIPSGIQKLNAMNHNAYASVK